MKKDILISGIGGQGVLTLGKILIEVAAEQGNEVTWTSSYGAEMRGGSSNCTVVLADEEIGSPYPDRLDLLVAFSEKTLEENLDSVREGGVILLNGKSLGEKEGLKDKTVYLVDAKNIAVTNQYERGLNIAILGALIKVLKTLDYEGVVKALTSYFEEKNRFDEKIIDCFKEGYEKVELEA